MRHMPRTPDRRFAGSIDNRYRGARRYRPEPRGIAVVASRKTDDVGDQLGGLVRPNLGKVRLTFEHDEQAVQQVTTAVIGHRVRAHLQAAIPRMAVDNAGSSSDLIVSVACMRVKPGRIRAAGQPGGKRHARALEGPIDEADYGLPRFRSCRFAAAYPWVRWSLPIRTCRSPPWCRDSTR